MSKVIANLLRYILFFFIMNPILAQVGPFYKINFDKGKDYLKKDNFPLAILAFEAARDETKAHSEERSGVNDLLISAHKGLEKILESARDSAFVEATLSRANRLAYLAENQIERDSFCDALHLATKARKELKELIKWERDTIIPKVIEIYGSAVYQSQKKILTTLKDGQLLASNLSPSGQFLIAEKTDSSVWVWDVLKKDTLLNLPSKKVIKAVIAPNGSKILLIRSKGWLEVWDIRKEKKIFSKKAHAEEILGGRFSAGGGQFLTWSRDNFAKLWNSENDSLARLSERDSLARFLHDGNVYDAYFSPDTSLVLTRSSDKTVRLWDVNRKEKPIIISASGYVYHAIFSTDGKILATCSGDTVRLWDLKGKQIQLLGHPNRVKSATFSNDGEWIITVSLDKVARLWRVSNNSIQAELIHTDFIEDAHFSKDSRFILTTSLSGKVRLWNIEGQLLMPLSNHAVSISSYFSPSLDSIYSVSNKSIEIIPRPEFFYQQNSENSCPLLSKEEMLKFGLDK